MRFSKVIVTGGQGFIGSAFLRSSVLDQDTVLLDIDKQACAFFQENNADGEKNTVERLQLDLQNLSSLKDAINTFSPDAIVHFAAESHVDKSIDTPAEFINSNVVGTYNLLTAALSYWQRLRAEQQSRFRFLHVSTDEVYGSISQGHFTECDRYNPASPYSASKAASDHLVRAWHTTYGLPTLISHCSNNYGPYQHPEKLIPHMVLRALSGQSLPVYGDGSQVRDWLYVEDHVRALLTLLQSGRVGETYNIAGGVEMTNLALVKKLCDILDQLAPMNKPYHSNIEFVTDRPGHDYRYGIDDSKLRETLDWKPLVFFDDGLVKTVQWYINYFKSSFSTSFVDQLNRQGVVT